MSDDFAAEPFEGPGHDPGPARFVVDLDGFEGPLDLLLALAREQKVDLKSISILQLAEQYLAFIEQARDVRLEVAADYLVMAAWLAYLKSRLLLPEPPDQDEPSGEELAARLQFQLERLHAMRQAAERLMRRDRLGVDVLARGAPEGVRVLRSTVWECSLYELLKAYAEHSVRGKVATLTLRRQPVFPVEEALRRMRGLLGRIPDWASLETFLPQQLQGAFERRSAMASTFAASLELVREGRLRLRQGQTFGPIFVREIRPE